MKALKPNRFPRIVTLIVNDNDKEATFACLDALSSQKLTSVVVIDNQSVDGSVTAISQRKEEIPILVMPERSGYSQCLNFGIRWALSKSFHWIFLVSVDATLSKNCIADFVSMQNEMPSMRVVGVGKAFQYQPQRGQFAPYAPTGNNIISVDSTSEKALFVHRSVWEEVGLFDDDFSSLWIDHDFCKRCKMRDIPILFLPKLKVAITQRGGIFDKSHLMIYYEWRNRLLWLEKHLSFQERRHLFFQSILREMLSTLLQALNSSHARSALLGIWHYFFNRFGDKTKKRLAQTKQML